MEVRANTSEAAQIKHTRAAPDDGAAGFVSTRAFTPAAPQGAVFTSVEQSRAKTTEPRPRAVSSRKWAIIRTVGNATTADKQSHTR